LKKLQALRQSNPNEKYQRDLLGYLWDKFRLKPWPGQNGQKGQLELVQDIQDSVNRQLDGEENVPYIFRIESGHGTGKTFISAAITNWFFDCFTKSITITTAPTDDQVKLLLWKDIRKLRRDTGQLKPSEPYMAYAADWFAIGRVSSNNNGQGTAKAQGQHAEYQAFIFDEAEGVPGHQYDATDAMLTGNRVKLWILIGNPQGSSSNFAKIRFKKGVINYRFNCLDFPNVVEGKILYKGGADRQFIDSLIEHQQYPCEKASEHIPDAHTFSVPWRLDEAGQPIIYKPSNNFLFRVMGIAPESSGDKVFFTRARYENAVKRDIPLVSADDHLQIGIDAARFGNDSGRIYYKFNGYVYFYKALEKERTDEYIAGVDELIRTLAPASVSVRVDGTGGFGSGIVDEVLKLTSFQAIEGVCHEVHFGSNAYDEDAYRNIVTEMYAESADVLQFICVRNAPAELEEDLTDREFKHATYQGVSVKQLEEKEKFRDRHNHRSPDDGDGFVLAVSPEHIFRPRVFSGIIVKD
jgi:hypothetical protein